MGIKRDRIANFKVQRPIDYDEKAIQKCIDQHGYVLSQIKYDGIRGVLYWDKIRGQHIVVTRENIEIVSITERLVDLPQITPPDHAFDCEVVIPGLPFEQVSGTLRRFATVDIELPVVLHVFDVLGCARNLEDRLANLDIAVAAGVNVVTVDTNKHVTLESLQQEFKIARSLGHEGIVAKNPKQHYTGNKVQGWWKMKPSETLDGVVIGFVMGEVGKANEGKVVGFKVRLEDASECNATGFTQELMTQVTVDMRAYQGRYVQVKRMEATDAGNSRHCNFDGFRDMIGAEGIKA